MFSASQRGGAIVPIWTGNDQEGMFGGDNDTKHVRTLHVCSLPLQHQVSRRPWSPLSRGSCHCPGSPLQRWSPARSSTVHSEDQDV